MAIGRDHGETPAAGSVMTIQQRAFHSAYKSHFPPQPDQTPPNRAIRSPARSDRRANIARAPGVLYHLVQPQGTIRTARKAIKRCASLWQERLFVASDPVALKSEVLLGGQASRPGPHCTRPGQNRRAPNAKSTETISQTFLRLFLIAIVIVIVIGCGVDNNCDDDDDEDSGFADSVSRASQEGRYGDTFRSSWSPWSTQDILQIALVEQTSERIKVPQEGGRLARQRATVCAPSSCPLLSFGAAFTYPSKRPRPPGPVFAGETPALHIAGALLILSGVPVWP